MGNKSSRRNLEDDEEYFEDDEGEDSVYDGSQRMLRDTASSHRSRTTSQRNQSFPGEERDRYALSRALSEEEEMDLLAELKAEKERVLREQQFLIAVRDALIKVQAGEFDSDEEEGEEEQIASGKKKRMSKRRLAKKESFSLPKARQPDLQTQARKFAGADGFDHESLDPRQSRRRSVRQQMRLSIQRVPKFDKQEKEPPKWTTKVEGEGSRAWNNPFASRLALMRKFYDWNDIPMDFFIDQYVEDAGANPLPTRGILTARLAERNKLNSSRNDNKRNIRESLRRSLLNKSVDITNLGAGNTSTRGRQRRGNPSVTAVPTNSGQNTASGSGENQKSNNATQKENGRGKREKNRRRNDVNVVSGDVEEMSKPRRRNRATNNNEKESAGKNGRGRNRTRNSTKGNDGNVDQSGTKTTRGAGNQAKGHKSKRTGHEESSSSKPKGRKKAAKNREENKGRGSIISDDGNETDNIVREATEYSYDTSDESDDGLI